MAGEPGAPLDAVDGPVRLPASRGQAGARACGICPLPWVRAASTATLLANYWLTQWETPRMTCTLRGYWDALALEKSDVVTVDVPLVAAFGTVGFAIRAKRYRLGEGVVELEGVELDRLPSVL